MFRQLDILILFKQYFSTSRENLMPSQDKIINIVIVVVFAVLALLSYSLYSDLDSKNQQVATLQIDLQNKTLQLENQAKKIADLEAKISEHDRKLKKHAASKKEKLGKAMSHRKKALHKKGR